MTLAWIAYILLLTVMLGVTALALEQLSRRSGWGTRWVWAIAIGASLVMPVLLLIVPRAEVPQGIVVSGVPTASRIAQGTAPATHSAQLASMPTQAPFDDLLILSWIALSTIMIGFIALSWLRLRRAAAGWTSTRIADTTVLVSDDLGPAVVGYFPGRVVIPGWILQADVSLQRVAVLHENQHLSARDPQLLLAALSCVALMPWNLPLWWLLQRLRTAVEIDCDARVLRSGEDVVVYGRALLDVASSHGRMPLLSPSMIEPTTQLERRIRLLDTSVATLSKPLAFATAMALLCVAGIAMAQVTAPQSLRVSLSTNKASDSGPDLLDALIERDSSRAQELVDTGAEPNYRRAGDGTPLIVAARNGDVRMVTLLLAQGADVNRESLGDGNPLIVAAAAGNEPIVSLLVAGGADVNAFVEEDETPLINAARGGHINVVKYLLDAGADANFSVIANRRSKPERRSALSEAEKHERRDVADYLRANGAKS
jgi:beta-lactamase regulating signal transducer with metallopeptidase domain